MAENREKDAIGVEWYIIGNDVYANAPGNEPRCLHAGMDIPTAQQRAALIEVCAAHNHRLNIMHVDVDGQRMPLEGAEPAAGGLSAMKGSELRARILEEVLEARGVGTPCDACGGLGVKAYGSTATWRGGIGGQAITNDVCDKCWGSGDKHRPWPSHRLMRPAKGEAT